jgi:hypothetical protein
MSAMRQTPEKHPTTPETQIAQLLLAVGVVG